MNGRGDDTMTMLQGYAHMVKFFTSFDWWKAEPHDELVDSGNYCLAAPGLLYAVYLPHGGTATVQLQPGYYDSAWFNVRTGEKIPLPRAEGRVWVSPPAPDSNDWALLLQR
jgi:collagenase-like protein with putative collagen-binding domain